MDDLIRRSDAIALCKMALDDDWEPEYAEDRLNELPAVDAVEVVRCRECEFDGACNIHDAIIDGIAAIGTEVEGTVYEPEIYCPMKKIASCMAYVIGAWCCGYVTALHQDNAWLSAFVTLATIIAGFWHCHNLDIL